MANSRATDLAAKPGGSKPRAAGFSIPQEPRVGPAVEWFALYTAAAVAVVAALGPLCRLVGTPAVSNLREAVAALTISLALVQFGFLISKRQIIAAVRPLRYFLAVAAFFAFTSFVLLVEDFPGTACCHGAAALILVICYTIATDERHHVRTAFGSIRAQGHLLALERQISSIRLQGYVFVLYTLTALLQKIIRETKVNPNGYRILDELLDELAGMAESLQASADQIGRLLKHYEDEA